MALSSLSAVWALQVTVSSFARSHRAKVSPIWRAWQQATQGQVRPRRVCAPQMTGAIPHALTC